MQEEMVEAMNREPNELTKQAIEQLKAGEGNHADNVEEFIEKINEEE